MRNLILSFVCVGQILWAQPAQMSMLGNWHDDDLIQTSWLHSRYNDVWGFVMNGQEYAVIGSTEAIHIFSLDDPANPVEVARVTGAAVGTNLVHRDMKEFAGYLYCVADEGPSTLQIIDLHPLPDTVHQVYSSNEFIVRAHNIFIDTSQHRLYAVGAQGKTKVLDISNPVQPVLLASYPNANYFLPYVHDAYIDDNIGYMNCGGNGLWVVDFTDPQHPVTLGTLTNYPDQGYNHSGWISQDGNYYFMCDETLGMDIKVVDISDPTDLKVVAKFSPGLWDGEIAHNVMVRGHLLYASYYYDGVQVWDVSDPVSPRYWGYYDTYPGPNEFSYAGNWGIYSLLPSNTILASDMSEGLFVLKGLPQPEEVSVHYLGSDLETCEGEVVEIEVAIGMGFSSAGVSVDATLAGLPIPLPMGSASPGDTLALVLNDLPSTGDLPQPLVIEASDGIFTDTDTIIVTVHPLPQLPVPISPVPGSINVSVNPDFSWSAASGANSYIFQLATDGNDFEASIIIEKLLTENHFSLPFSLDSNTVYFWRVVSVGAFCEQVSPVATFTTGLPSPTEEAQRSVHVVVYPNPASGKCIVSVEGFGIDRAWMVLCDVKGRQVIGKMHDFSSGVAIMDVSGLSRGAYWLSIFIEGEQVATKLVLVGD